jgi:beta-galactosidase
VLSQYGKGRTLLLGSFVSAAYQSTPSPAVERFYAGLLDWAGVVRPVASTAGNIEVKILESSAEKLVFVFNHAKTPVDAAFSLRGLPRFTAKDLITGEAVERFQKKLDGYGVWVLRLTPQ